MVPDVDVVKCWALEHGIKGTFSALCENEKVKRIIIEDMLQWGRTAGLKNFEQVWVLFTNTPWNEEDLCSLPNWDVEQFYLDIIEKNKIRTI